LHGEHEVVGLNPDKGHWWCMSGRASYLNCSCVSFEQVLSPF